jgi:hypothetical protein
VKVERKLRRYRSMVVKQANAVMVLSQAAFFHQSKMYNKSYPLMEIG